MMWVGLRCGLQHTYIEGPTRWPTVYLASHHTMTLCDFTLFTFKALWILPGSFFKWLCVFAVAAVRHSQR